MTKLIVYAAARADFEASIAWYLERSPTAAARFEAAVGIILTCLIMFGSMVFFDSGPGVGYMLPWILISGVVTGAIYGYLAGVMVGGVFLVADRLRRRFKRNSLAAELDPQTAASPFDVS